MNDKEVVRNRQQGVCDCCGEFTRQLQVHHRMPRALKGTNDLTNYVGVCPECHEELNREAFQGLIYPQVHWREGYYPQGNREILR